MPHVCTPPYVHMPPYICMPPGVYKLPICLPYSSSSVCSQRLLHFVGVVRGLLHVRHLLTPPLYGGASPYVYPTHSLASLCISMFWGYLYVIWGIFPYVGDLGVFPNLLGFWGHQHMGCPCAYSCTFL